MMRKKRASNVSKELSLKCSVKGCMFNASCFGCASKELDSLQWCNTHYNSLHSGEILVTKKGLKIRFNNNQYEVVK